MRPSRRRPQREGISDMKRDMWKGRLQSLKGQLKKFRSSSSSGRGRTSSTNLGTGSGLHSNPDRNMGIGGINRDVNLPQNR